MEQKTFRVFVSYSWSTPDHQRWVIELAEKLVKNGVDVVIDKWDLKPGHDAIAFMEKMVSDDSIDRVIMVVDRQYAEKSDSRSGGVGTEAQIISKKVFDKQDQNKFVALLVEKDDQGHPYLPVYYSSRIYVDFSEPQYFEDRLDELLRLIYNQPLFVKPPLGSAPIFETERKVSTIDSKALFTIALDALKTGNPNALGRVTEYLTFVSQELEKLRVNSDNLEENEFDDLVISSIDEFLPVRNEFILLISTACQFGQISNLRDALHSFLESIIPYCYRPESVSRYRETDWDNFKFIVHELFLHTVALLLKFKRYKLTAQLLESGYFVARHAEYGRSSMIDFTEFSHYVRSIDEIRNKRLELRRLSLHADLLKQRSEHSKLEFQYLMQADFILYLRAELHATDYRVNWWPVTLLYACRQYGPFELFARAESETIFSEVRNLLGIEQKSDFEPLFEKYRTDRRNVPRWEANSFSPEHLIGYEQLGTKP